MPDFVIKRLSPALLEDYFDFFDNRAFADGSPFYPCYCNAFNMSRERIQREFFAHAEELGGGNSGWKNALRESAVRMVQKGEVQGYLVFDNNLAVGWCNTNDRLNYFRTGEFDLSNVPPDEACGYCTKKGEIKSIVCFEISPDYRGKGIATLLLNKICEDAKLDGYKFVEAYPAKNEAMQGLAFTGPKRLYDKAGFSITEEKDNMLIMRKALN